MSEVKNIKDRIAEIEKILTEIENGENSIEEVVEKYRQALSLAKDLEDDLNIIKNEVEVLEKEF